MQFQFHEIIPHLTQYICFYGDTCSLMWFWFGGLFCLLYFVGFFNAVTVKRSVVMQLSCLGVPKINAC